MKHFLTIILALCATLFAAQNHAAGEVMFERKLSAAKAGDIEAQYDLGYRYEKGRGTEQDDEQAVLWYLRAAEQGLDKAEYKLGLCYLDGTGIAKDEAQGMSWLEKAAEKGYMPAQYQLGKLLAASNQQKNLQLALEWLQKAQDNGYEPATMELRKLRKKLD